MPVSRLAGLARLAEADRRRDRVGGRERGGHVERQLARPERREAAEDRTRDEADAERGTQQAEQARPLRWFGEVAHRGLGDGVAAARSAVDRAAEEKDRQRPGEAGHEAADGRPAQCHHEYWLAPDPVRQPAPPRRGEELRQRERGHDRGREPGVRPEVLGVQRKDREDDAEADQVDRDGGPQDAVAGGQPGAACWMASTSDPSHESDSRQPGAAGVKSRTSASERTARRNLLHPEADAADRTPWSSSSSFSSPRVLRSPARS